jgi:hypothetical protein
MRKITKRSAAIAAAAVLAVGAAGGAYAAGWLVNGEATASATAAEAKDLNATVTVNGAVYPGASLPVTVAVNNENAFAVKVTKIDIKPGSYKINGGANKGGCNASTASLDLDKAPLVGMTIWPGQHNYVINNVAKMGADAHNDCQLATFSAGFTFQATTTGS